MNTIKWVLFLEWMIMTRISEEWVNTEFLCLFFSLQILGTSTLKAFSFLEGNDPND